jgi:ABC-type amino acid transport substrate-binding protein
MPDAAALPDVIVPASFNFPHSGKLLSISFILFAGWFADALVPLAEYPRLALSGLISFFGSLNVAVPFLLDLFRIPSDTFQLFLATGVINSRFGTLLAAVHTLAVALLGTCAMVGVLRWHPGRMLRYFVTTAIVTSVVLGGVRTLFGTLLAPQYRKDEVLAQMHLLTRPTDAVVHRIAPTPDGLPPSGPILTTIRTRGSLRVGYLPDSLPFAFFNARGDLVGFDVELAHRLASELRVRLEFVPVSRATLSESLAAGECDLLMSGVAVTTLRASEMLFSVSYLDETMGLLVLDHDRERFASWRQVGALGAITIGVPDIPYFVEKLHELAPGAIVRTVKTTEEVFGSDQFGMDALALPAERGSAWTLLYPQYSMVVPEGALLKIPLAYPIGRKDEGLARFINTWIELKRKDGTLDTLFKYWILGQNAAPTRPRWSIARDVLHWIE